MNEGFEGENREAVNGRWPVMLYHFSMVAALVFVAVGLTWFLITRTRAHAPYWVLFVPAAFWLLVGWYTVATIRYTRWLRGVGKKVPATLRRPTVLGSVALGCVLAPAMFGLGVYAMWNGLEVAALTGVLASLAMWGMAIGGFLSRHVGG